MNPVKQTPRLLEQQPRGKKYKHTNNSEYNNPRAYRFLLKRENAAKAIQLAPCDQTATARLTVAAGLWPNALDQWQEAANARGLDPREIAEALELAHGLSTATTINEAVA